MRFVVFFAGRPCFCLKSIIGLIINLAIGSTVLIAGEIVIDLLAWSL